MKAFKILGLALGLSCGALGAQSFTSSEEALMVVRAENFPQTFEKWSASPLGQFCASKEMSAFLKPLQDWWAKNAETIQQELKLAQKPQLTEFLKGELMLSLDQLNIDYENKEADIYGYILIETGKNNKVSLAVVESLLKSLTEKDEKHERKDLRFMNHLFHTFSFNPKQDDTKDDLEFKKGLQLRFGQMDEVFYLGFGRAEVQEKKLNSIIPNLGKSKKPGNEIDMALNMLPINKLLIEGIKNGEATMKANPPQPGPAMFLQGLDWVKIISALGLLDFKNVKFATAQHAQYEKAVFNIELLQEPRGLMKMFLPEASMNLGEVPAWMPEDVITYQASSFPMSKWYGVIMAFMQQEVPMFAPIVMGQLDGLKQNFGVDLEKDIFGLFDDKLYQVVLDSKDPKDLNAMGEEIYVVKVKNGALLEQNLLKVLKMNPMLSLEAKPYMGGRCYEFPSNCMANVSPMLAFHSEYLIYSNRAVDVRTLMLSMATPPQKNLGQSRQMKAYRDILPERYQGFSYQNSNLLMRKILEMLGKNAEALNASMSDNEIKFDFNKLPKSEDVKVDLGSMMTVTKAQGLIINSEIYTPKVVVKK